MPTTAIKRLTVEEYERRSDPGDGTTDELLDGRVVSRPLPGARHGIVCGRAGRALGGHAERTGGVASLRCGLIVGRNPDSVPAPDVLLWRTPPADIDCWPDVPPAVVVEVVDGDEPYHHIHRKVLLYLRFEVPWVWVVAPLCESVTEYRAGRAAVLGVADALDGGDVLPGFSCRVADLFG